MFHRAPIAGSGPVSGPDPERRSYNSFATFSDPDGNGWLLQEVTARLPGRVDADEHDIHLGDRPRSRAATCCGRAWRTREAKRRQHDANWPDWYAEYIVQEQAGKPLPS